MLNTLTISVETMDSRGLEKISGIIISKTLVQ